jgi:hypothetical protein
MGSDRTTAVLWLEYCCDGESRGGAIAGECNLAIHRVTSRNKSTGMEWGTRRAHQGRIRRRSWPEDGAVLGMADGSDGGSSEASSGRLRFVALRKDRAERCSTSFL